MRTVVLRIVAVALLLALMSVAVLASRLLQRIPDMMVYMVVDNGVTFTLEAVPRRLGAGAGAATGAGGDVRSRVSAQVEALVRGPTAEESSRGLSSAVPSGVRVLDAHLDGGVLQVDLSSDFERGGGTASMIGRLNQLYYTLSQPSDVDVVVLELEGEVVEVFGGEGIMLDVPWVRMRNRELPVW